MPSIQLAERLALLLALAFFLGLAFEQRECIRTNRGRPGKLTKCGSSVEDPHQRVTSKGLCQQERGADALVLIFVIEDGEQDAIHRGAV